MDALNALLDYVEEEREKAAQQGMKGAKVVGGWVDEAQAALDEAARDDAEGYRA